MNTICNFPDIDVYLLLFLDLKNIIVISIISRRQYELIIQLDYIKELNQIKKLEPNIYKNIMFPYKNDTHYNIVDYAAKYNCIALIRYLDETISSFVYTCNAIINACKKGHIEVLNWFDKSNYEFLYNDNAINYACLNGHIQVLDWFDKSNYEFLYNNNAITYACLNGHIQNGLINLIMNLCMT